MSQISRYGIGNGAPGASVAARDAGSGTGLVDVLDRVLDKGLVIAGDIRINLLDIELLTIKVRLLIASADKAREMGIDWWAHDPALSSKARPEPHKLENQDGHKKLVERMERMESQLSQLLERALPSQQQEPKQKRSRGSRSGGAHGPG